MNISKHILGVLFGRVCMRQFKWASKQMFYGKKKSSLVVKYVLLVYIKYRNDNQKDQDQALLDLPVIRDYIGLKASFLMLLLACVFRLIFGTKKVVSICVEKTWVDLAKGQLKPYMITVLALLPIK